MNATSSHLATSSISWDGEIFAGIVRTRNWSAHLLATSEELVLTGPMSLRYALPLDEIEEIRCARGKLWVWSWQLANTVSIVHRADSVPARLAFRTRNVPGTTMVERLATLGYPVECSR